MGKGKKDTALVKAESIAVRLDPEPAHALHVRKLAVILFTRMRSVHGMDAEDRRLLETAALLHDTCYSKGPDKHHKRARDLILGLGLPTFSEEDHRTAACIARYHRGCAPKPTHKIYRDLPPARQDKVAKLAALLRIADGLDRSHLQSTRILRCESRSGALRITVSQEEPNEADLWGAEKKSDLAAQVFDLEVSLHCAAQV
jgi:exopolyphosphatase/guanosine-5'-triphosphate,3'-diphosphate pyrophosphatase